MSLLSTSHTYSFKRTKNILHTILLSICFVFANSAFATSNPSSSISQNTEVYLVATDWIDSSSTLIFNPVSEKYFLSKTESSNNSLVFSQPFSNPDTDGDGIDDAIDLDDDNDGILDTNECEAIDSGLDGSLPFSTNITSNNPTDHTEQHILNSITHNGITYSDFIYPNSFISSFAVMHYGSAPLFLSANLNLN